MYINADGAFQGSVSGGCVEAAVIEKALEVCQNNSPALLHFGVSDETAWEVGLACGGQIDVLVEGLDESYRQFITTGLSRPSMTGSAVILSEQSDLFGARVFYERDTSGADNWSSSPGLPPEILTALKSALLKAVQAGASATQFIEPIQSEVFLEVNLPAPTLMIIGGVHIASALVKLGNLLGFETIIVDPRRSFASAERFPTADVIINEWPETAFQQVPISASTALAILTHDPKIDDAAVRLGIKSQAFYVGALGSRNTQAQRKQRLLEAGCSTDEINRIKGPIGLDLGGRAPAEIALAIMAEIIQQKYIQFPRS
jgi:xanthine dehydrogenase accessory factor